MLALDKLREAHTAYMQALSNMAGLRQDIDAGRTADVSLRIAYLRRDVMICHRAFLDAITVMTKQGGTECSTCPPSTSSPNATRR